MRRKTVLLYVSILVLLSWVIMMYMWRSTEIEDLTTNFDTEETKYLMFVPGYGPNNQYRGLKEMMVLAKALGRVFVRPTFVAHHVKGLDGLREFDQTFEIGSVSKFVPSISIQEYAEACENSIDVLLSLRDNGTWWTKELDNYLMITNLKYKRIIYPQHFDWNKGSMQDSIYFEEKRDVLRYLKQVGALSSKCLGIAFPFRTLSGGTLGSLSGMLGESARSLQRSQHIVDKADMAIKEFGSKTENLVSFHWRHGEQTCRVEEWYYHKGYDFCWGTSSYFWANLTDVISALKKFVEDQHITHIYLATDTVDTNIYQRMKENLPISRASDISVLSSIDDNYYLSLVEQEICTQSKIFIGSSQSTWTEYIHDYWSVTRMRDLTKSYWSLDRILKHYGYGYVSHSFWSFIESKPSIKDIGIWDLTGMSMI
eukprot:TRINITY_DN3759_c0_g1_i2.p1 TRINITY_DN3759_c0_g1~~TRINITY_DN3759_c0_g1_i2.p1  ORF type:complete len:426 (-),score=50.50 TRINITY_DN3759_c0_g1_i2:314-1591(-)